jgi:hypothetical protein
MRIFSGQRLGFGRAHPRNQTAEIFRGGIGPVCGIALFLEQQSGTIWEISHGEVGPARFARDVRSTIHRGKPDERRTATQMLSRDVVISADLDFRRVRLLEPNGPHRAGAVGASQQVERQ